MYKEGDKHSDSSCILELYVLRKSPEVKVPPFEFYGLGIWYAIRAKGARSQDLPDQANGYLCCMPMQIEEVVLLLAQPAYRPP